MRVCKKKAVAFSLFPPHSNNTSLIVAAFLESNYLPVNLGSATYKARLVT